MNLKLNLNMKGGYHVRKFVAFSAAVLISGMVTSSALAHQDRSFTNITTFGIFETMYDFFKYSPAYLPSFEKAALWTQLSNLQDASDELFDWYGTPYYLIGLQTDIMGMGRGGGMLDWYSEVDAISVTNYPGDGGWGELETTRVDYQDLDNDEIIDFSEERYGRLIKEDRYLANDIYLVFGMGDIGGFAMGASVRGQWNSYQPTWNDWLNHIVNNVSLDEEWSHKQFTIDPLGNKTQTYELKGTREGELNYGTTSWEFKLGARNDQLVPGIDLVANVGAILNINTNTYEYKYQKTTVPDLLSPSTTLLNEYTEKGMEPGNNYYPGSGIGFLVELRGDMALNQDWTMISEAGFSLSPVSIDGEQERITNDVTIAPVGVGPAITNYDYQKDTYEGSQSNLNTNAKVRFVYQGQGWRLGLGARGYLSSNSTDRTRTYERSDRYRRDNVNGIPDPTADYTTTVVQGFTEETKDRYMYNTLELPIGLELPIVENGFVVYFGAQHTVYLDSYNTTVQETSRHNRVTTQTFDNGVVVTTVSDIVDEQVAEEETQVYSDHYTNFMAGFSWYPAENMRVDVKNVFRVEYYRAFELSFNFFF